MREILFRGKSIHGEWVKGFYVCVPDTHYIMTGKFDSLTNGIINSEAYKVDPATVGQFTGLTDKNGVKIFEGDIVLHKGECGLVGYSYDYGMFEVDFDYCFASFIDISASNCEVIGNIHDNPELLEVSGDEP